ADANENARLNDFDEADYDFVHAAAETSLNCIKEADSARTLVIVDPPRKGLEPELLSVLADHGPSWLLYVSCNPATLARDLKELADTYSVQMVQPVDMFPWTTHVESIILMTYCGSEGKK
ncbi:MAG: 23S rRNA (uracil(1939)-C(5))-methyltransferase RlmD, partial [Clostridium sp.]|nr:23S rRNA (uracil(1939)-C(5))-methyltransferase RlmD [Clostridium sp.]